MYNQSEQAYLQALLALKRKDYQAASEYFDRAAPYFEKNKEFNLLRETNRLLLAVKKELGSPDADDRIEVEEMFSHGQGSELR